MKKRSLITLIALVLLTVMTLSSCGSVATASFKSVVDGSTYDEPTKVYNKVELSAVSANSVVEGSAEQLVLFSKAVEVDGKACKKYAVYNLDANAVVYEITTSAASDYDIDLVALEYGACFTVEKTAYRFDQNDIQVGRSTTTTTLYGADGVKIAETGRVVTPAVAYDLLRFDGKCYRMSENATLTYAFDFSDLNKMPSVMIANEEYYFCATGGTEILIYTKELEFVSSYAYIIFFTLFQIT